MMTDFEKPRSEMINKKDNLVERTQQLQKEIQSLDENGGSAEGGPSFFSSITSFFPSISLSDYSGYIFAGAIALPFIVFGIVYNTKYALNEEKEIDRKKVLKITFVIVIVCWILLYIAKWYMQKQ